MCYLDQRDPREACALCYQVIYLSNSKRLQLSVSQKVMVVVNLCKEIEWQCRKENVVGSDYVNPTIIISAALDVRRWFNVAV